VRGRSRHLPQSTQSNTEENQKAGLRSQPTIHYRRVVQAKALPTSFRTARARHDTDVTDYGVLPSLDREGRAGPYFGGFMVKAFAISGFEKDDVTALA
jgi:hypothetical protein